MKDDVVTHRILPHWHAAARVPATEAELETHAENTNTSRIKCNFREGGHNLVPEGHDDPLHGTSMACLLQHLVKPTVQYTADPITEHLSETVVRAAERQAKVTAVPCTAFNRKSDKVASCGTCKLASYCSIKCQRDDWRSHKRVCAKPTADEKKQTPDAERHSALQVLGKLAGWRTYSGGGICQIVCDEYSLA